mgnify:CR=1 FL=1
MVSEFSASTQARVAALVSFSSDPLSDDGTVALTGLSFSKDGSKAAYTISRRGSDTMVMPLPLL